MIDLHVHTTASDGVYSPSSIVTMAKHKGLTGLAITDHDTIAGISEALATGDSTNMIVVPGLELSTVWGDVELHILGYYLEYTHKPLLEKLAQIQAKRKERIKLMLTKANKLGIKVSWDELNEIALGESIGRPHFAQLLIIKGYTTSIEAAFEKYLTKGKPLYYPRYKLTPTEGIKLITACGGIPVLAHPGLYPAKWQQLLPELVVEGLQGIEVFYPAHNSQQVSTLSQLGKKYGLIMTSGSDFHRGNSPDNIQADNLGSYGVPITTLTEMKERKKYATTSKSNQ